MYCTLSLPCSLALARSYIYVTLVDHRRVVESTYNSSLPPVVNNTYKQVTSMVSALSYDIVSACNGQGTKRKLGSGCDRGRHRAEGGV